jgi:hypothetical protein
MEARMRIVLLSISIAAGSSFAAAQSSTAMNFTTAPANAAPSSATQPSGQKKVVIAPAARAGERGLRVGEGAANEPIEIRRLK